LGQRKSGLLLRQFAMTLLHKGGFIKNIETIVRDWSKTFPGKFIFKLAHSLFLNFVSLFYFFKQRTILPNHFKAKFHESRDIPFISM
jgi:hypothetical protein